MNTRAICEKWYKRLGFPAEYDAAFYAALGRIEVLPSATVYEYDLGSEDGLSNLLHFLYFCEALEERYRAAGIGEEVLLHTLRDLVIWTDIWSREKGALHLGELPWLAWHLKMELFRIGTLEYKMGKAPADCPALGLKAGDAVLDVHIPHGSPFTREDCLSSLAMAKAFFREHYPDFAYRHFTCHSWLLDRELLGLLREGSNILGFAGLFTPCEGEGAQEESFAALRYVFTWGTTRKSLDTAVPTSGFAARMKAHVLGGGKLYESAGAILAETVE